MSKLPSKRLSSSPQTPITLYFEPLEPRILLSADLLGGVFGDLSQDDDLRGYQDIDISSYPDFSKYYLLRGSDETSIRKVFSPMVISHFEKNKGLSVEVNGDTLICYRQSKRVRPTELKDFLYEGRAVFGLFHR